MEKITFACIKYRLKSNPTEDLFVQGDNHGQCIEAFSIMDILSSQRQDEVQGFMTSSNRFVTRAEAYQIAKEAGQLIKEDLRESLDSYNLKVCRRCRHSLPKTPHDASCCRCCEKYCFFEMC